MNKIESKLREKSGIYMFFNMVSGNRYVGSSQDIYNRIHTHVHNLKNNKAHNKHFQSSWNKYGEDAFVFCVLEYCDPTIRFEREQYYIDSLKPEYNLTLNVVANFGHSPSEETKSKISETLKSKYQSGEIETYKQQHVWKTTYIYDVFSKKLVAICNYAREALNLIGNKKGHLVEDNLYQGKYIITTEKFKNLNDLTDYINKTILVANSINGKYMITESPEGEIKYHRYLPECAKECNSSRSTLSKHPNATKENPYIVKKSNYKFYYSDVYIPVNIDTAVLIEESLELQSGNIGEIPKKENPEINSESKESESSYSVEDET